MKKIETSKAAQINKQRENEIKAWKKSFYGMLAVCLFVTYNNIELRSAQRLWLPPDLSGGQLVQVGEPDKAYTHNFALLILSSITRWKVDGEKEYLDNIKRYETYIGPKFRELMIQDYNNRRVTGGGRLNELKQRTREITLLNFDSPASMVRKISSTRYHVYLDVLDEERISGEIVKSGHYRYVLEVAVDSANAIDNDTGLRVMGLVEPPKSI
ncbi:DUF2895 family protein [Shewanella glacialipiscicola]|uniref:DUF2895 family protein n=1 Tax=Shewanella glacialipiscicola TaxID=614069 RepID=UPI000029D72A